MGIISREVEVKVQSSTIAYYESLGYEIPKRKASEITFKKSKREFVYDLGNTFMVKVCDLTKRSNARIDVLCDCCGDIIRSIEYSHYNEAIEKFGDYVCSKCRSIHQKRTFNERYGCDNPTQDPEIRARQINSLIANYGVDNPTKNEEIRQRVRQTTFDRYGCWYASQSDEYRQTFVNTMLERYNVEHPMQIPEVREKAVQTMYANSSQKCSRQQLYLYHLYNISGCAQLNFPISKCSVDICLVKENIAIEYDGGGHNLGVTLGEISQEEFDRKELIRDKIIRDKGYKIIRIKSKTDKLPQDDILFQMLDYARNYFSTTQHTWVKYDIDNFIMLNATNKNTNGIPYDFGTLRRIKDGDLPEYKQNKNKTTF